MTSPTAARPPRPVSGPPRDYHFPRFERRVLANGLRVVVAPVPKLPLVTISVLVDAGAVCDPVGKEGLAQLMAKMLVEGTTNSDGAELALRFERLGASVESYADWDAVTLTLTVMSNQLAPAFALASEVLLHPAFPDREVERLKGERLAELLQLRAEPRGLADETFAGVLYDRSSRFSTPEEGTDASVTSLTRADVAAMHAARCTPGSTTVIVVGDVDVDAVARLIDGALGAWTGIAASPPAVVATSARIARTLSLAHRPDAPQTELRVGQVGVPRGTPDYFHIVVMNAILGGLFNSRINLNLREAHGYTYGAFSGFDWRRQAGPFVVSTAVRSDVTDASVREIFAEIERIRETKVAPDELSLATSYLDGVFPIRYETTASIASALANLTMFQLPDDYFDQYRGNIRRVTVDDVLAAAQRHLDPTRMQVLAVGDADAIEAPLRSLGLGAITRVDLST